MQWSSLLNIWSIKPSNLLTFLDIWDVPFAGQHVGEESKTVESDSILKDLADKVRKIDTEVQFLEGEYKKDLLEHDKVCLLPMYCIILVPTILNCIYTDLWTSFHSSSHETTLMNPVPVNHMVFKWQLPCSVYFSERVTKACCNFVRRWKIKGLVSVQFFWVETRHKSHTSMKHATPDLHNFSTTTEQLTAWHDYSGKPY